MIPQKHFDYIKANEFFLLALLIFFLFSLHLTVCISVDFAVVVIIVIFFSGDNTKWYDKQVLTLSSSESDMDMGRFIIFFSSHIESSYAEIDSMSKLIDFLRCRLMLWDFFRFWFRSFKCCEKIAHLF